MADVGKIPRARMKAYADQARRIGKVDQSLTPAEIETILLNVNTDSSLPEAESGKFGTLAVGENDIEVGIYAVNNSLFHSQGSDGGYSFTINEACSIVALRCYGASRDETTLSLWTISGELLGRVVVDGSGEGWKGAYLDNPVNLAVGETYVVSRHSIGVSHSTLLQYLDFNPKIQNVVCRYAPASQISSPSFPSEIKTSYLDVDGVPDIVFAPVSEIRPTEYRVQRLTLDAMADTFKSATGATGRLSIGEMQGLISPDISGGLLIQDDKEGHVSITSQTMVIDDMVGNVEITQEVTE